MGRGNSGEQAAWWRGKATKGGEADSTLGLFTLPYLSSHENIFGKKSEKFSAIYLPFHIYPPIFILPWNNFRQNIYPTMILFLARVLISKTNISNICYIIEGRGVFQCQCQWSLFKYSKSRKFEPYFHTNHGKKLTNATEERKVYRD